MSHASLHDDDHLGAAATRRRRLCNKRRLSLRLGLSVFWKRTVGYKHVTTFARARVRRYQLHSSAAFYLRAYLNANVQTPRAFAPRRPDRLSPLPPPPGPCRPRPVRRSAKSLPQSDIVAPSGITRRFRPHRDRPSPASRHLTVYAHPSKPSRLVIYLSTPSRPPWNRRCD